MSRNYTIIYRLVHWTIAVSILLLLCTVFLRMTWLNKEHVATIIQDYLNKKDIFLSQDDTVSLAKQIRKPMWQWHIYLGYVLSGLFFIRFTLPLFGEMKFANPFNSKITIKEKFQYWIYIFFYLGITSTLFTGLMMELGPKSVKKTMEEIHVLALYYTIPFLILHVGGVLLAENTSQKGLISRIISGKDENKA